MTCRPGDSASNSLLKISEPDVLLWALKPAEEGLTKGIIARVWNQAHEPRKFSLSLATGIETAIQVTHIETDLASAEVVGGVLTASAGPSQLLTFRLFPEAKR